MALTSGTKLGPYEITGAVGAGGMGEVYRARDTRLGRDVAIKVLPAPFARDEEHLRRFQREAHRDKVKGTVTVPATIDTRGKASHVRVVRSLRSDLDKLAVSAVKKWKFEPAKKNGEPVMVKVNIDVNFDCTQ
jgi:TonB family protein